MANVKGRAVAPREHDALVVSVRMPRRIYERLKALAEADERSTAWMARRLLESALEEISDAQQLRQAEVSAPARALLAARSSAQTDDAAEQMPGPIHKHVAKDGATSWRVRVQQDEGGGSGTQG